MRPSRLAFNRNRTWSDLRRRFSCFFTVTADRASDRLPLALCAIEADFMGSGAEEHDAVEPGRYQITPTKDLAADAFPPISSRRMPDLLGRHDAEARRTVLGTREDQEHEMGRSKRSPITLNT